MKEKVFIDSSIFIQENYIEGDKIQRLIEFGNKDFLELYVTEITLDELKKHINNDVLRAKTLYKDFRKDARILRNGLDFKHRIDISKVDVEKEISEIMDKFNKFLKYGKVQILPYSEINIRSVFNSYFKMQSPFGSHGKKNEFPDAFSIALIEKWCDKNLVKCHILSKDKDFQGYSSKRIQNISNFPEFINEINF